MIVDIHAHLSPPEMAKRFPMPPSLTDVDGMLAARDAAGVDLTIIGSPVGAGAMVRMPGVDNYAQPADRLRAFHAWMASVVHTFPDRLRAYVYLNPLGGDDELAAARETASDPAFVGFIVNSSVNGTYLDGERADDFFAMAAQDRRPVLVHAPAEPVGAEAIADLGLLEQVGRFGDVTNGLAAIAFAGWLEKYPLLRLVGATGGGCVAALPERLDAAARRAGPPGGRPGGPPGGPPAPSGPRAQAPGASVRRLWLDTAVTSAAHLRMNLDVLGPDRMMFGSDSPPLSLPLTRIIDLVDDLGLTPGDRARVLGGNAAELFGLDDLLPTAVPTVVPTTIPQRG